MAKKRKAPKPDADGILRTGIYQRQVGELPKLSRKESQAALERMVESLNQPATATLAELRHWLKEIAMPFLEGPYSDDEARAMTNGSFASIDFGDGVQAYRKLDAIDDGSWEAEQARNAIEALTEIRVVEHAIDGNQDWLFRSTLRLGRLIERITIRPYEPLVVSGKRSLDRSAKGGKASKRLTAEQETLAKEIVAKKQVGGISKSAACNRAAADLLRLHDIEVSAKTLSRL